MYATQPVKNWATWVWIVIGMLAGLLVLSLLSHSVGQAAADEPKPPPAVYVVAPCDGVYYAGEYFGDEPLVHVGSAVTPDTVVGTIEGMRTMPVHAGVAGQVVELLVSDSQMVWAGQPLMRVQPPPPAI